MPFARGFAVGVAACAVASCVYYNAMYDTERAYERAVEDRRSGSLSAANAGYDSVIVNAERLIDRHPDSRHAGPAALLKARAEVARQYWDAVLATTGGITDLTDDPRHIGLAAGLEGIARRALDELEAAERLLSRGLESDPPAEDRAQFHFHRGLARLDLGSMEQAAEDLEAVAAEEDLALDVQLDLAGGLSDVGQLEAAVELTDRLFRATPAGDFGSGMDPHLDSLVRRAPAALDSVLADRTEDARATPTRLEMLRYFRGLSHEVRGDTAGALALYEQARADGARGRYGAEAAYRWARLRLVTAERPEEVTETLDALVAGRRVPEPEVSADAIRLATAVEEFGNLVSAYRSRGGSAAEAALRAAELAGSELGARRIARGLYLRYLDLAPASTWQAKAIGGAMLHAAWSAGEWASDDGAATNARLRARLSDLPATDPYRVSIEGGPRNPDIDSAYVEAERDLRRRLVEIRMLYDTTAVLVEPSDTADVDEDGDQDEDGEPQNERDVEF